MYLPKRSKLSFDFQNEDFREDVSSSGQGKQAYFRRKADEIDYKAEKC